MLGTLLGSFYSKLVRLKGYKPISRKVGRVRFLFQTGAIKRAEASKFGIDVQRFYSKLVRLKEFP